MPEVQGVKPFDTQPRLSEVQKKVQLFCRWNTTGFPGSQPVSMQKTNLWKLNEKPYRVSWKADGVRYGKITPQNLYFLSVVSVRRNVTLLFNY